MRCVLSGLIALLAVVPVHAQHSSREHFQSHRRTIAYDLYPAPSDASDSPILILLPGSSGPSSPLYRSEAAFFAQHGFRTLMLHYFDADTSHYPAPETYTAWSGALADLVGQLATSNPTRPRFILGFSLGASVALAAGSQRLPVTAIAEWYGSLPDVFFFHLQGMPPLLILHGALDTNIPVRNAEQLARLCTLIQIPCESHIYPAEEHGFSPAALADANARTLAFFQHPPP